jgi:hypothetical protein
MTQRKQIKRRNENLKLAFVVIMAIPAFAIAGVIAFAIGSTF